MDGFKTAADMLKEEAASGDGAAFEEAYANPDAPGKLVQITEDGGVTKEIIVPGTGWEEPEAGDSVRVHYVGTLLDGTKFDSSRDRNEPFEFDLGQGKVIQGWDLGVATMKRGEKSKLTITAQYGYGESGSPPTIPGGATLVFEVELIDWKSVKDILGDGGVIKTVVREGVGWSKPQPADEVCARFTAKVQGASQPFYSSAEEGEEFRLCDPHFCPAINKAVATMKLKEQAKMLVKPQYGFGEAGRGEEVPPGAALEIELTLLGWKKVEKVTDDGQVMKKTLQDTEEWKRPNSGAQVTLTYTARLPDGTVFDEKSADAPLQFTVDEGQAPCEGLELAVLKMKEGERALVTIAPQYAFGEQGSKQALAEVPPNSSVEYDVTLSSFVKAKDSWEMDAGEKLAAAALQKDKGNTAFKSGQYARAVQRYNKATEIIEFDEGFTPEQKQQAKEVKRSCNLNLAAAQLKLGNAVEARKAADKVLEGDSGNLKALYRRAQAYLATADFVEAELDIKRGLAEDSASSDFKLLLKKAKHQQATAGKKEASLYSGMMKALGRSTVKDAAPQVDAGLESAAAGKAAGTSAVPASEVMEQP
ncbi:Peptidyl-prolyl cis-trans isomerase [Chlorella vulgaris]